MAAKDSSQIVDQIREEGAAAAVVGEDFQGLVAGGFHILALGSLRGARLIVADDPFGAGADGVDDDAGALGHVQGFARERRLRVSSPSLMTTRTRRRSILAPPAGSGRLAHFLGCSVDGVVERGAAAGTLAQDGVADGD